MHTLFWIIVNDNLAINWKSSNKQTDFYIIVIINNYDNFYHITNNLYNIIYLNLVIDHYLNIIIKKI